MNTRQHAEDTATLAILTEAGKANRAAHKRCSSQIQHRGQRMADAVLMLDEDVKPLRKQLRELKARLAL